MFRLLMVEDDAAAAELTLRALRSQGLPCDCERVADEADFLQALARPPDLIVSDSNVPGFPGLAALSIAKAQCPAVPFIFVSGHLSESAARRALSHGATDFVDKADPDRLASVVRAALQPPKVELRRTSDQARSDHAPDEHASAAYLLERQAALDRTLDSQEGPSLAGLLSRHPPVPAALILIQSEASRDRYFKVLRNARIEVDIAAHRGAALALLASRVHALLFTDQLDVIQAARQLSAGSATHIVFVTSGDQTLGTEALRAGANDSMPEDPRGEHFWSRLTTARRIVSFAASLQSAITDNRILATIDELTRCGNRRFFEHQFPREVSLARRQGRSLSLVMSDIDHFKAINDRYGHPVGDEVLQQFAERLIVGLRLGEDWVARIGGEEFGIVLPETGRLQAIAIAERLCERVRATSFVTSAGPLALTASFGVCGVQKWGGVARGWSERMVRTADAALYAAKHRGRNCAVEAPLVAEAAAGR